MGKAAKKQPTGDDSFDWARANRDKKVIFEYWWNIYTENARLPESDYVFHPTRGWKLDWSWPELKIAVEVDGGQWQPYGGRHARDEDRDKCNEAEAMGWHVFHFSTQQLESKPIPQLERVAKLMGITLIEPSASW